MALQKEAALFAHPIDFISLLLHAFDLAYSSFQDKVKTLTAELDRVRKQAKEVCPGLIVLFILIRYGFHSQNRSEEWSIGLSFKNIQQNFL